MAVITTAQLDSTVRQLIADHPGFHFYLSPISYWSSKEKTVYYSEIQTSNDLYTLFHELGHGLMGHTSYQQDIELLKMEREAWEQAKILAKKYGYTINDNEIEDALDSYRDWLYARSRCPVCHNPGIQKHIDGLYACLLCSASWRANDARQCGLKRYTQK